jgi:hypothetical protein
VGCFGSLEFGRLKHERGEYFMFCPSLVPSHHEEVSQLGRIIVILYNTRTS